MSKIVIGNVGKKSIGFDTDLLLAGRLLATADSGGGKSWLVRVLLEQTFGKVQTITIDPEGEFASLREKFSFVLAGKGGETPTDLRSAGMLAHRLLKLRVSAICDLYEMKSDLRHLWVKAFLDALVEAPKELRTPVIVVIDEAHMFCPEKGQGESEAKQSVIDVCTRGRKRGICPALVTQRLAMLDKNATSQLQNRLIGPTFEEVNIATAIKLLGIAEAKEKAAFHREIQLLEPGNFFALGRAISRERILIQVRGVETTHPKAFEKHTAPLPPTPEKIKNLLPQLADLPAEAEKKAQTEAEYKREIRELKAKLSAAEKAQPAQAQVAKTDPAQIKLQAEKLLASATKKRDQLWLRAVRDFQREIERRFAEATKQLAGAIASTPFKAPEDVPEIEAPAAVASAQPAGWDAIGYSRPAAPRRSIPAQLPSPAAVEGLKPAHVRVLNNLAELLDLTNSDSVSKEQLAAWSSYSPQGGGYSNVLGCLRTAGMLDYGGLGIVITAAGRDLARPSDVEASNSAMLDRAKRVLKPAEAKIFEVIHAAYPEAIAKEQIAEQTGYTASGGGFGNYLGHMRTLGFITYTGGGCRCADWMFIEKGNGAAA